MSSRAPVPGSGGVAEQLAAERLCQSGYVVREKNYRCPLGEIDIVAEDGDVLCFIEVKFRAGEQQGHPLEAITPAKRRTISLVALHYLQKYAVAEDVTVRFDAVAVTLGEDSCEVEIVPGAFESSI
ncbi:MAG: YraN family protein [Candidatus Omnitrophica bacterium]|nr:YraN family protein [Candidatus Omnitrophota bacterium]MCB9721318.1 YraN family protein [Candidatus Omnitrophota bacterium]